MRVSRQYSTSAALLIFSYTGEVESKAHKRQLLRIIKRLYGDVKRGRGYALGRSQLMNLYTYISNGEVYAVDHTQVSTVGHHANA